MDLLRAWYKASDTEPCDDNVLFVHPALGDGVATLWPGRAHISFETADTGHEIVVRALEKSLRIGRDPEIDDIEEHREGILDYPNGDVEIEAPEDKEADQIRAAAQRRARWIFQHRNAAIAARRMALPREYVSGETHFYLGRRHKLIVHESKAQRSGVKLLRGKLKVALPVADRAAVRRRLNAWYSDRATEYLSKKVGEISERLSWINALPPFKLMRMRTQWGSCSPEGVIYLNPVLIKAPRHCIEYVILHEFCHLIEHNHSTRFFDLLTSHMPDWKTAKRELDSLAELILAGNE